MQKFTPPSPQTELPDIAFVLRQLYRRRLVVRRLIRSLELYSSIQSRHQAFVPKDTAWGPSQHTN
jgi:hypothetical protein